MKEGIVKHIQSRTDEQLYTILFLDDPADWQPEALEAARAEWERRGLQGERLNESKAVAEQQKSERDAKADEPLSIGEKTLFFFVNFGLCCGLIGFFIAYTNYGQRGYERKYRESLMWMGIGVVVMSGWWILMILMSEFR